ncbi:MAG: methyltransferase [Subdoligranulum sp.]|nr:methyltransferase [Subdoligranulum sp.]
MEIPETNQTAGKPAPEHAIAPGAAPVLDDALRTGAAPGSGHAPIPETASVPDDVPQRETLANGTPVYITKSHRFGQDALLLAHFCGVRSRETVCDLGCGCGVIALRWHDRGHRGPCLAVELSPGAAALARRAAGEAGAAHITVQNCDLRDAKTLRPCAQTCSLVACNPPYFTGGILSPDPARAAARHTLSCTMEDVCAAAFLLLRDGGRLCVCQRPERLADVLCAMRAARIEPKRLQLVAARPEKAPWLVLIEGQKNRAPGLRVLPTFITTRADGTPSRKMLEIYGQAQERACQPEAE